MRFQACQGLLRVLHLTLTFISQFRLVAYTCSNCSRAGRVVKLLMVLAMNESLTYPGVRLPKSASSNSYLSAGVLV